MTRKDLNRRQALLALAGATLATRAAAADFPVPGRPVRIVVGYPAGGGTDVQARVIAQFLAPMLGVPVIVENRPGGGTMLGAMEIVRSAPDGHTLMYTPTVTIAQLPHTLQAVKYDAFRDFTPVAQCAVGPTVLVLHNSIPATTVRELAAYAKAHPGELNYVSQGQGTPAHIYGQMLARQLGVDMVHVPYKGANDVTKDFIAGRVHLQFAASSAATALASSGKVRLLGVVAARRSALFPDLPTMTEAGVQDMELETKLGLIGPAGMAPATVSRLARATREVMANPKVRENFQSGGVDVQWLDAPDFARGVRESDEGWRKILAAIDFKKE